MDFKDYYSTLGVAKTASREGNQAGVPEAGAQAPSRRQPGRQVGRGEVQGDQRGLRGARRSREAQEVRRARRQLARCTSRPAPGGAGRRIRPARLERQLRAAVSRRRRLPHDDRGRDARDVRRRPIRSPISSTRSSAARAAAAPEPGGRGAARGRARRAQGRDVEQEIELGLEDAYHGTTRRFSITHDGHARTVDVRIPAGVGDGSRVRVAGEGEHGSRRRASPAICICASASRRTRRSSARARDLYTHVPIPLTTAVLGGEVEVPTLGGKSLRLKIPPTTQNGAGVPAERPRHAGRRQAGRARRSLRDRRRAAAASS